MVGIPYHRKNNYLSLFGLWLHQILIGKKHKNNLTIIMDFYEVYLIHILFRCVSDRFNVGKATAWRSVKKVVDALCKKVSTFVKWPTIE